MNDYVLGRKGCLVCGGTGVPLRISRIEDGDYREYQCPSCGYRMVSGIISTDGQPGHSPITPPSNLSDMVLPLNLTWSRAEVWWGGGNSVGAINGRAVVGDEEFYDVICKMESIYERS